MSESNRVALRMVAESDYGVTPPDSLEWKALRYTSESLSGTPNTVTSTEIRTDRMTADQVKTGLSVAGDINIELSMNSFDDLLEAVMCDTWTLDVLKVGGMDKSFSIEKHLEDINKFIAYTGMRVSATELSFAYGEMVTGKFSFMGNGISTPAISTVGTGAVAPAATSSVLNATTDLGSILINGIASPGIHIKSISLNLDNQYRAIEAIGSDAPIDARKGTASVTGSVEAYLSADSFAWYSDVLNQSDVSISWSVSDAVNSYTFLLPRVKFSGEAPQSGGLDQDVMITVDFTALFHEVNGTSLQITRT